MNTSRALSSLRRVLSSAGVGVVAGAVILGGMSLAPAPAQAAVANTVITSTKGPLNRIAMTDFFNTQVTSNAVSNAGAFWVNPSMSTFVSGNSGIVLAIDGTEYNLANGSTSTTSRVVTSGGAGTAMDPFWIQTQGTISSKGVVTVKLSYVEGDTFYRTDASFKNTRGNSSTARIGFYYDCFVGGDDAGHSLVQDGTVPVCRSADGKVNMAIMPTGKAYVAAGEANNGGVFSQKLTNLPNACIGASCGTATADNAMAVNFGLQTVPNNTTISNTHYINFDSRLNFSETEIGHTASATDVAYGDEFTYTVTAKNIGPANTTRNSVQFTLPSQVTYVSDNAGGAYDPTAGTWTLSSGLANGATASLTIRVRAAEVGTATSQVTSASSDNIAVSMCAPTNLAYCGPAQNVTVTQVVAPTAATLVAAPTQVIAAPSAQSNITLTTRATNGIQMLTGAATVALSSTLGTLSNVTNNNDGTYSATLTSNVVGTATVTGTVNGVSIPATATVDFIAGPPAAGTGLSTLNVSPGSRMADGSQSHTVTVTMTDAQGNLISGKASLLTLVAAPASGVTVGSFSQASPGVYTAAVTSTSAGVKSLTATYDKTGVNLTIGSGTATFVAGAPAGTGQSIISATTGNKIANNSDAHVLTATVKDANGNPVSGVAAQLSVPTRPAGVSVGSFTEGAAGVYTARVTSTVAAPSNLAVVFDAAGVNRALGSASVTFVAGPVSAATSTLTVSTGPKTAGEQSHTAQVTVTDAQGNPVSGQAVVFTSTATLSGSGTATSNASGSAIIQVSSLVAGEFSVSATIGGAATLNSPQKVTFVAGAVSLTAGKTRVSATTAQVEANGTATHTVTATVQDANGNPVPGATVTFTPAEAGLSSADNFTQVTGANGIVTLRLSSTTAGDFHVATAVNGTDIPAANGNPVTLTYRTGAPSSAQSSWTVTPDTAVVADGKNAFTATVTVMDANKNKVANAPVDFAVPAEVRITEAAPFTTDDSGQVTVHFTATAAGTYPVSAALGATRIGAEKQITFTAGSVFFGAGGTTLSATTGGQTANGSATHTASVLVVDQWGNPVKNADVVFRVEAPATAATATAVKTGANGRATVDVTSEKAGEFDVTATVNGTAVTEASPATVRFVAGAATASASTFSVTPNGTVTADGTDAFTAKVVVKDATGNPVSGSTVSFGLGAPLSGAVTAVTNASGEATTRVTSTTAGTFPVSASLGGAQVGADASLTFIAGGVFVGTGGTTLGVTTQSTTADGVADHTATVRVVDRHGNPVTGADVVFAVERPATASTPATVRTGADGIATVGVVSETAGSFDVTATVNGTAVTEGSPAAAVFIAGAATAGSSEFVVSPNDTVTANGTDAFTAKVTVKDAKGNPVSGQVVAFTFGSQLTGTTTVVSNSDGVAISRLTSQTSGSFPVSALLGENPVGAVKNIVFAADAPVAGGSDFAVTPGGVEADGLATHTATVTVRDVNGNPVPDVDVEFTVESPAEGSQTVRSDADGLAEVSVTSTMAGSFAVSASIGGDPVGSETVLFEAGAAHADHSSWVITPNGPVTADGSAAYTAVVTVLDAHNNPVPGATLTFSHPAEITATAGPYVTGTNGTVTVRLTSATAGTYPVTALLGGDTIGENAKLRFVAGAASATASTVGATPSIVQANGTAQSAVTVTLSDADGNRVTGGGDTVVISSDRGVVSETTDNGNGTYSATVTSLTGGAATVSYVVNGAPGIRTAPITFVATPASPILLPSNGGSVSGTAAPGTTVTVYDATGRPLGHADVRPDGTFTVATDTAVADGVTLTVIVADVHGFESAAIPLTVDAAAPAAASVAPSNGSVIYGTAEKFATVTVYGADGLPVGTTQAGADGKFLLSFDPVLVHEAQLTITVTDSAQNVSAPAALRINGSAVVAPGTDPSNGTRFTGSGAPGNTITVILPDGSELTTVVGEDGRWSSEVPAGTKLADGDAIRVIQENEAGTLSPPTTLSIDTVAPDSPVVNPSGGRTITGGPVVSGDIVTVVDEDGVLIPGTVVVDGEGVFTFTPVTPFTESETPRVIVTDPAGNPSVPVEVLVDTTAPDSPVVNPSGGRTITGGPVVSGDIVTVVDEDGVLIPGTVVVDGEGVFTFTPVTPFTESETPRVIVTDPAGNPSVPVEVLVDTTAPDSPVVNPSGGRTITGGPVVSGDIVTVVDEDGVLIPGTVVVDGEGVFTFTPVTPFTESDTPQVIITDPSGNSSVPVEVAVDTTAPVAPTVKPSDGYSITGGPLVSGDTVTVVDTDGTPVSGTCVITEDGTFRFTPTTPFTEADQPQVIITDPSGNSSEPVAVLVDMTVPENPVVRPSNGGTITGGPVASGDTVSIVDEWGRPIPGELVIDEDGTFTFTPETALTEDDSPQAFITDPAGNSSEPVAVVVDTTPPAATVVDPSNGGTITGGPLDPGETITVVDEKGAPVPGDLEIDQDGRFTFIPKTPFTEDDAPKVIVIDPSGNPSAPVDVLIDTTAPSAPTIDPSAGSTVTGSGEPGGTVTVTNPESGEVICTVPVGDDGRFECVLNPVLPGDTEVTVTVTDPSGNRSASVSITTDDEAPGEATVEPSNGQTITVRDVEGRASVTLIDAQGREIPTVVTRAEDGSFTVVPSTPLTETDVVFIVVTDPAGNASAGTRVATDTTPPTAPAVSPSNGQVVTGGILAVGDTVTVVDAEGNPVPGVLAVDTDGRFSFAPEVPLDTDARVTVVVTDAVGNSVRVAVVIDTEVPTAPKVKPTGGGTVTGSAEPGSTVTVTDAEGSVIGEATAGADGLFTVTLHPKQQEGSTVNISVTDPSGNVSGSVSVQVGLARVELQSDRLNPGSTQVAYGSGFQPGEVISGVLHSTPIDLGTQTADAEGNVVFTVLVPADIELGKHSVVLSGSFSGTSSATFEVAAVSIPELVVTGGTPVVAGAAALLLLSAGGLLLLARRRRLIAVVAE
ncbi:Ig-like domain-containing protein [Klugiella xanthotipulae]|uniref:Ig-like domain-containing protein n=1 Tax=Klugiella xanthotipulae TaxID=244735 RepID=UPI0014774610|nr:invasin domain 3-containing protein [Klugiella xanthotipulae]